jgi:hypothetical protein
LSPRCPPHIALGLTVALAVAGFTASARAQLAIGPDVNVSAMTGTQGEVGVAVNPVNPQQIIIVSNNNADLSQLGAWFSTNGGATWTANFIDETEDGQTTTDSRFDPNVAFDSDGNVYVVYSLSGSSNRLMLARSTNGGQAFNQVVTVTTDAGASNLHTPMVTTRADATGADDVLVVWARVAAGLESIEAGLSLDAGATFPTINNNINDTPERTFMPWASANANGTFNIVWEVNTGGGAGIVFHDTLNATTLADLANDNQVSTVQITDFAAPTSRIPAQPDRGLFSVATVDVNRATGRIYVSYTDRANTATNDTNIFVRSSTNGGVTWTAPVRVNDDATTTSQFMPRMGVDPANGSVYVVWYDARNDATNNQQVDVFVSTSTNNGTTWAANQRVTTARSDESTANAARNNNNYTEYMGLAVVAGGFQVAWTDARAASFTAGNNEEIFTSRITREIQVALNSITGSATALPFPAGNFQSLSGSFFAAAPVNLGAATMTIQSMLRSPTNELVAGVPVTLVALPGGTPNSAVYVAVGSPSVVVEIVNLGPLGYLVNIDGFVASIARPSTCGFIFGSAQLTTRFTLNDGVNAPIVASGTDTWQCFGPELISF